MNIKEEIEKYLANCNECENMYATDGRYANAIYTQGEAFAYRKVLRLLEEAKVKIKTQFSWDDVNIGDTVKLKDDFYGEVVGLIYTDKGFSGMEVSFKECSCIYRDDEYKGFLQIGDWINEN